MLYICIRNSKTPMKKRLGKARGEVGKHLGRAVGSSRKRNLKRINNKAIRQLLKKEL